MLQPPDQTSSSKLRRCLRQVSVLVCPSNSDLPISEDEANEPDMIREEEENFGTLGESFISFRLSGLNGELSRDDQPNKESAS